MDATLRRQVGKFLRLGPVVLFGLFFLGGALDGPSLDLAGVHAYHAFLVGALAYLFAFVAIAAASKSIDLASQEFFPDSPLARFSFLYIVGLALFSLTWGANFGLAANLMKSIGASQTAKLTGRFVRYQRYPKSNCGKEAVFSTTLGELALCDDGFPSKIHPRLPMAASLVPGEPVMLAGRKNRLVFIPEKVTRSMALP